MTAKPDKVADVVLSYAPVDEATASAVRREFESAGLAVIAVANATGGKPLPEAVRGGIQDQSALVAVVTPTHMRSDNLALEVGAAWGLSAPIYLLLSGVQESDLPAYLRRYPAFPLRTGVAEVVEAVRRQVKPLTDEHRRVLTAVYQEVGVPVDRLMSNPDANADLAERFTSRTRRRVQPTRLLRELLRLRKTGHLPRLTAKGTP